MAMNEKTSDRVASIAGALSRKHIDAAIQSLIDVKIQNGLRVDFAIEVLKKCKSLASSALTQAADKNKSKKRKRK